MARVPSTRDPLGMRSSLPNPPSLIEHDGKRFLLFDAPNEENLPLYITEFKKYNVKNLVRACDPTYSTDPLRDEGITVLDLPFTDGQPPPAEVINPWLDLLHRSFKTEGETIGVHCVAGLGRAPVLVAIALIEYGMPPLEAVEFIRQRRRGSVNMKQLQWLKTYKPRGQSKCNIM